MIIPVCHRNNRRFDAPHSDAWPAAHRQPARARWGIRARRWRMLWQGSSCCLALSCLVLPCLALSYIVRIVLHDGTYKSQLLQLLHDHLAAALFRFMRLLSSKAAAARCAYIWRRLQPRHLYTRSCCLMPGSCTHKKCQGMQRPITPHPLRY